MLSRITSIFPKVGAYGLYASTIFLSAFLLFQVQPIAGKHLLPWFGGSSSVWATSVLFFTTMLFLGYLYVYILGKYDDAKQAKVHIYVVGLAGLAAIVSPLIWRSFYPPLDWTIGTSVTPTLEVLFALLISVGIPYFLLATTGPLLQYWYGITEKREPYKLYALSNIGSFLALGTYPFFFEPHLRLVHQEALWTGLFVLYVLLATLIANRFAEAHKDVPVQSVEAAGEPVSKWEKTIWVLLAALPSLMLVATTTQITQVVAPIPFLWVLPLSIYLLSFVFAFWGLGRGMVTWLGLILFSALAYAAMDVPHSLVVWRLVADLGLLFFCGLFCHGSLYGMRPGVRHVPLFYLLISFGGMIGALCASIIAPLVFNELYEFPLGILLCAVVAIAFMPRRGLMGYEFGTVPRLGLRILVALLVARAVFTYVGDMGGDDSVLSATRNFYGTAKVQESAGQRILMHGGTLHGIQSLDREFEFVPTTYYSPNSGVARAIIQQYLDNRDRSIKVGVIGLGTGTLNAYCGSGDEFVFFEIDPRIVSLAKGYFTYSTHCDGYQVRVGDARIVLEAERREGKLNGFDVLAVDAFNDDTIPIHLVTREAMQLFVDHLRGPESILAVHTSNRYLDLPPAVISIAESLGLTAVVINSYGEESDLASSSEWVLIARDPAVFDKEAFESSEAYVPERRVEPWTDDYADVLGVVWIPEEAMQLASFTGMSDYWRYQIASWILPEPEETPEEAATETVGEVVEE